MKYKEDLGFAIIESNKKISKSLKNIYTRAFNLNRKLFKKSPEKKFKIFICNNNREWKKKCRYYYLREGSGTVLRNGNLVIKDIDFLNKTKKDFQVIVEHEMNHVFYILRYHLTKPIWIYEGLAYTIAGFSYPRQELVKRINRNPVVLNYRYLKRDFSNINKIHFMYSIWREFILYLTNNKPYLLISFMDEYIKNPVKSNYHRLFRKYFKKSEKIIFREFLLSFKHLNLSGFL